ncbi:hypothetical protein EDD36DRAFT_424001 [Exophiala viscosa]|uniref:Uncharacterized protein n=1 Tax=Exophiala viscosa TaxID=2486360 RepID=A0AAN6E577_9EURO|nr:hypothetical protein EDD36DRAFT_424001 [Exophiala viscosa]
MPSSISLFNQRLMVRPVLRSLCRILKCVLLAFGLGANPLLRARNLILKRLKLDANSGEIGSGVELIFCWLRQSQLGARLSWLGTGEKSPSYFLLSPRTELEVLTRKP